MKYIYTKKKKKKPSEPKRFTKPPLLPSFSKTPLPPHIHHRSNTIALLHNIKSLINIIQCLAMRDKLIHLQLPRQIIIDQIGELGAAFDTAKGTTFPDATRDELECCDLVGN